MGLLAVTILKVTNIFLGLFPVLLVNVNHEKFTWQKITTFYFARLLPKREGEVVKVATSHVLRFFST